MMIFISYRIADANDIVARLDDSLTAEFGRAAVFRDKTRLQGGRDWQAEIERNAKTCAVMLVVIGKAWASAAFDGGRYRGFPRLYDPSDWVRREVTAALDAGTIVVPAFANGGVMPDSDWLDLVGLSRLAVQQGVEVRTDDYATDLPRLIRLLRERCTGLPARPGSAGSADDLARAASATPAAAAAAAAGRKELDDYLDRAVADFERRSLEQAMAGSRPPAAPYKFLYPFGVGDAAIYFGRDAAASRLYDVLLRDRLTVVHAPSGAGKTSLLQAGVGPRLVRDRRLPVYARAYQDPVQAVKRAVAPPSLGPWPALLPGLTLPEFLGLVRPRLRGADELVVVFDQFEELFTVGPAAADRRRFFDDLSASYADPGLRVRVVIGVRKDYFSDLAELREHIPSVFHNEFHLPPMTRQEAAAAITGPVKAVDPRVTFDPALLDQLLADLGRGGMQPPHLQLICSRLYEQRGDGDQIGVSAYADLGGAEGVLGRYLRQTLDGMAPADRQLARQILGALVTPEGTRHPLAVDELLRRTGASSGGEAGDVLASLVAARLLQRDDGGNGGVVYDLAHDYLAAEVLRSMVVLPTGAELQAIQQALLSAFPSPDDLRQLATLRLDVDLERVVPTQSSLRTVTFHFVRYFAAQPDGLRRLLAAARAENPGNQPLAEVAERLRDIRFAALPLPGEASAGESGPTGAGAEDAGAASMDPDQFRILRDVLLNAFRLIELDMLVTYSFGERLEHIVPVHGRTLPQVVSDLLRYYARRPGGVQQLIDAAAAERPRNDNVTGAAAALRAGSLNSLAATALAGEALEVVQDALLGVAQIDTLKVAVSDLFHESLEHFVGIRDLRQVVFDLLKHFGGQADALPRLVAWFRHRHPDDPALAKAAAVLTDSAVPRAGGTPDTEPGSGAEAVRTDH